MTPASKFFTESERKAISSAVAEAERMTSGEVIPVVATISGRYDRAEDLFGVVVSLLLLALSWIFFQEIRPFEGNWSSGLTFTLGLISIIFIVAWGYVVGTMAANYLPILRWPLLTKREMLHEVERSAAAALHRFRIQRTVSATGILIYVSLYERMVHVLADDAIGKRLSHSDWDTVRDLVIKGFRAHRPAEGLSRAILKCGELLSRHFPIKSGGVDINNELRIID